LQASPNLIVTPQQAAQLAQQHWIDWPTALKYGSAGGYGAEAMSEMVELATTPVGLTQLFDLFNREKITGADLSKGLERLGMDAEFTGHLPNLAEQLLPPALLADAVLRGWMQQAEAEIEAAHQGVTADRFQIMVDETGEPPGLMQLLEAFRRGFIDSARLAHGIKESRVRDEWLDVVEKLRYVPPAAAEAIEGAVKGHLAYDEAKAKAEIAGLDPAEFDWRYKTTGNPPGAMELLALLNRGAISEDDVRGALKQGHLADAYIDTVLLLRRRMIGEGVLLQAQQSGNISTADVLTYLQDLGYNATDSALLAATGSRAKIGADWQLGKTLVMEQYDLGLLSEDAAKAYLLTVGYDAHEADSIIAVADLAKEFAAQRTAVGKIQTLYVNHKMDAVTARAALITLGVPHGQVDQVLAVWTLERESNVRALTPAEIADAVYYQIMPQATGQTLLEGLGYSPYDAWVMLSLRAHTALPNAPANTDTTTG